MTRIPQEEKLLRETVTSTTKKIEWVRAERDNMIPGTVLLTSTR
jgi:hypothetical protein